MCLQYVHKNGGTSIIILCTVKDSIPFTTDVVASYCFGSCTITGLSQTFRWATGDGPTTAGAAATAPAADGGVG